MADVAVEGDRIVAVEPGWDGTAARTIDAEGQTVTPGFVDIHTHLDAQLAWDPLPTSSCWHGVTSVVLGNCGVTFAPVKPGGREFLAEMMESVEDIPRDAILDGLPWDWSTYGEYLAWIDRIDKGLNVGGMVGHCAVRIAAMGERSLDEAPATADDIATMADLVDEAMRSGALGLLDVADAHAPRARRPARARDLGHHRRAHRHRRRARAPGPRGVRERLPAR